MVCDREKFVLNERQVAVLKEATTKGQRGLIWFGTFAISIPHISSIYRDAVTPDTNPNQIPAVADSYYDRPEVREKTQQKIAEIRKNLGTKLNLNK